MTTVQIVMLSLMVVIFICSIIMMNMDRVRPPAIILNIVAFVFMSIVATCILVQYNEILRGCPKCPKYELVKDDLYKLKK